MGMADALAAAYDLGAAPTVEPLHGPGINNRVWAVSAGDEAYVLKQYQTHSRGGTILYEHRLLAWLAMRSLPFQIPTVQYTRRGETLWWYEGVGYALFPRLGGAAVWPPTLGHLEQIGAALAHLHQTLVDYPREPRPGLYGYGDLGRVHPALPQPEQLGAAMLGLDETGVVQDDLSWWQGEVGRLARFADTVYRRLPQQVIHGDYAPSNTLFVGDRLAAVVDFDMALPDVRAMDVAAGLTFALRVDEMPGPLARAAAFCGGYGAVQRLTAAEVAALPDLMALRDVVSTVWWLGRGLAAGDVRSALGRIVQARRRRRWGIEHQADLVACCEAGLGEGG